jgi:8-oxo-dGTP diphosphatase
MKQVVAALIVRGTQILICQRTKYQPMALQWEFPGGKIEPGEEAKAALHRELDEELAIRATIGPEVANITHNYRNGGGVELHFFKVEHFEGEIENRIFKEVIWAERATLPGYDFLEADKALVEDLAKGEIV